jgi:hypothetical protein
MSLKPSYPDVAVAKGFTYIHPVTGQVFNRHAIMVLHDEVSKFCKANGFTLNNEEFDDNICRNTANIVCTEGMRGAGDAVHQILNPIAKLVDDTLGTNLQGCSGCYKRQNEMNK